MKASGNCGGRSTQLILASAFIILMMGTLPIARANYSGPAYTALFYRTSCGNLQTGTSTNIEARFEWDISGGTNNTNTMTVKEYGSNSNITSWNKDGYFKLDEKALNENYNYTGETLPQYPGIEAYATFHQYKIAFLGLIVTEPTNGTGTSTKTYIVNTTASYPSANFSSAKDELQTQILQGQYSSTSGYIEAEFNLIDTTGTTLMTWTRSLPISDASIPPPYENAAVSDEIDGVEFIAYANMMSGTDFQIESVIHPSTLTDFTGEKDLQYSGTSNKFSITSCSPTLTSYVDEEGDGATYTFEKASTTPSSNEAWQYFEVT
jgi:hypothetical protein